MSASALFRKAHFVVTAIVGIPLLAWTLTGFAFTCFDFEEVRGTRERAPAADVTSAPLPIDDAIARARAFLKSPALVKQVRTRMLAGHAVHVVEFEAPLDPVLVDAQGGSIVRIGLPEASAIACTSFRGSASVAEVTLVERDGAPDVDLPAYRARMTDAAHTEIWIRPATGEIIAWRNDAWRSFDRLWSLHVFGFVSRDHPAQWPLRIVSFFALLAAVTGAFLLAVSLRRRR